MLFSNNNKFVVICEQQRRRPACTSLQSDQRLCCLQIMKTGFLTLRPILSNFGNRVHPHEITLLFFTTSVRDKINNNCFFSLLLYSHENVVYLLFICVAIFNIHGLLFKVLANESRLLDVNWNYTRDANPNCRLSGIWKTFFRNLGIFSGILNISPIKCCNVI